MPDKQASSAREQASAWPLGPPGRVYATGGGRGVLPQAAGWGGLKAFFITRFLRIKKNLLETFRFRSV